ncbi:muscleblind-like protein 2 isoform X1 [Cloeon dipterum]|uniref:muscleblind-like protein 2 isoform X1 n=1 Tax=Cloeon dipterum TaxID=197152 RepID=UPI0032200872
MAMVNMNNLLNGKDSRWLQLEVCREFQRNKCSRPDTECKFAHPPANVEVQNGRVTACYDSIKGRCNREKPPCKYFHPPQHLKDQLLINGRNHLALKNALMQQMGLAPGQTLVPGQMPASAVAGNAPFLGIPAQVAAAGSFSPFYTPGSSVPTGLLPVIPADNSASQLAVMPQGVTGHQKIARSDRLETASAADIALPNSESTPVIHQSSDNAFQMLSAETKANRKRPAPPSAPLAVLNAGLPEDTLQMVDVKSLGNFYYDAFTGMAVPYKRAATDKSGVPVYPQPSGNTLQQLMTLQQQPASYIPVTCEYSSSTGGTTNPQASSSHVTTTSTTASALMITNSMASVSSSASLTPSASTPTTLATNFPLVNNTEGPEESKNPSPSLLPQSFIENSLQQQQSQQQKPTENGNDDENEKNNNVTETLDVSAYYQQPKVSQASAITSVAPSISPMTALNYTGVALNKQMINQTARLPYQSVAAANQASAQNAFSQQLLMRANLNAAAAAAAAAAPSAAANSQMMQSAMNMSYMNPFMAAQQQPRLLLSPQMLNQFGMMQQMSQPHAHHSFMQSAQLHHYHPYALPLATASGQQAVGSTPQSVAAAALSYKKMKSI